MDANRQFLPAVDGRSIEAGIKGEYQDGRLSATVNIHNLFGKKYYSGLGLFETGFYGEPRSVTLTMRYQF